MTLLTSSAGLILNTYLIFLKTVLKLISPIVIRVRRLWISWNHGLLRAFFRVFVQAPSPLPPVFNPVLLLSATSLAREIRQRKVSSLSVVRAYIKRASEVNPRLNAVAQEAFSGALHQAKEVDERIATEYDQDILCAVRLAKEEPLLGVPFVVKESLATEGMLLTCGLISLRHTVASIDAVSVAALKEAGAILLCTTNVAELCRWWETENRLYGTTNNPYHSNYGSGGSGECSLVSACGAPVALGSDMGGSLRTSAFFCGVFSHKPSTGMLKNDEVGMGIIPVLEVGPISRHAEDLIPLLKILRNDNFEVEDLFKLDEPVDVSQLEIYTMLDDSSGGGYLTSPMCPESRAVQEGLSSFLLEAYDVQVQQVNIELVAKSFHIWREKVDEICQNYPDLVSLLGGNKGPVNVLTELVRCVLGRANHTWPLLLQALFSELFPTTADVEDCKKLLGIFQRLLGKNGVLLYPSHPTLVPYHREPFLAPFDFSYTAIFNALGLPVTQVPLGLSKEGLPLGIQVVGGLNMDRLTICVAGELERGRGGWRCPSQIL